MPKEIESKSSLCRVPAGVAIGVGTRMIQGYITKQLTGITVEAAENEGNPLLVIHSPNCDEVARFPMEDHATIFAMIRDGDLEKLTFRVRREGEKLVLTFKTKGDAIRDEANLDLSDWPQLFAMLEAHMGNAIRKTRFTIEDGGLTYELDLYEGDDPSLNGKISLEVEFPDEESMNRWLEQPRPLWLADCGAVDRTNDPRFKNDWLALHGWPPDPAA